jgi:predicted short-subunit dehydrogenase-like oxidoreductase (DUF2520 family)
MKIAIVGSGNIASFFGKKWRASGHTILQVISPTLSHAQQLAEELQASFAIDISELNDEADIYLLAVKDDVLLSFADTSIFKNKFVIHTAGAVTLEMLNNLSGTIACLWPVYSIQKDTSIEQINFPLVINFSSDKIEHFTREIAKNISEQLIELNDEQKSIAHVGAVFANNFTNHLYTLSKQLLAQYHIPFDLLKPLIENTTEKLHISEPEQNQTGPAIRHDEKTMKKHLDLLKNDKNLSAIYKILSSSIENIHT